MAIPVLELVVLPDEEVAEEHLIRDVNDRTIMRAAIAAKVDVILTGDKDFLESGIKYPAMMTAAEFLACNHSL